MSDNVQDFSVIRNDSFPNTFQSDKWNLTFSNIPTLESIGDMKYFDNYIKSFTLPSYAIDITRVPGSFSYFANHPQVQQRNENLEPLIITYKLSENMFNYLIMFKWIMEMKHGVKQDTSKPFRKQCINVATFSALDNQKREIARLKFFQLLPNRISALPLEYGTSDEVLFTMEFAYQEIDFELINMMGNGCNMTAPQLVTPVNNSLAVPKNPELVWN